MLPLVEAIRSFIEDKAVVTFDSFGEGVFAVVTYFAPEGKTVYYYEVDLEAGTIDEEPTNNGEFTPA